MKREGCSSAKERGAVADCSRAAAGGHWASASPSDACEERSCSSPSPDPLARPPGARLRNLCCHQCPLPLQLCPAACFRALLSRLKTYGEQRNREIVSVAMRNAPGVLRRHGGSQATEGLGCGLGNRDCHLAGPDRGDLRKAGVKKDLRVRVRVRVSVRVGLLQAWPGRVQML